MKLSWAADALGGDGGGITDQTPCTDLSKAKQRNC